MGEIIVRVNLVTDQCSASRWSEKEAKVKRKTWDSSLKPGSIQPGHPTLARRTVLMLSRTVGSNPLWSARSTVGEVSRTSFGQSMSLYNRREWGLHRCLSDRCG